MVENKKNILAIAPIYYPHYGGAEKAVYELYKGVSDEFDVDLLTPNFGGEKLENNGYFKIYRVCNSVENKYYKFVKYQIFFFLKGFKLLRKNNYEMIHTHYTLPTGVAGLLLSKLFKIPLMITEHHYGTGMDISSYKENPKIVNPVMRFILRKTDVRVSTGATQNEFFEFMQKNNLKYDVINLGGDCKVSNLSKDKILKEFNMPKNKKIIFSISRLVKRKRYDIMIEAAKIYCRNKKDALFLIGGKGPELENLNDLIKKYKLENNVKLLGFVSDADLEKYRKISDVFVSTSEFEGAGIIYFEAFASKLPLFAKKNLASKEAIENGKNGLLFNNSKELAALLDKYLSNKKKLEKLSKEGHKIYKNRYNWNKYSSAYKNLYHKFGKNGN